MTHLHFEGHFVPLLHFFLHVGHVGENAFTTVDVTNEAEAFVGVEHGHLSMAGFVHRLHVLILGNTDLDVFEVNLFTLQWIWRRVYDSAQFIDISDHVRTVQSALVALGFLLLRLLLFFLLRAFRFSLTLPERFL